MSLSGATPAMDLEVAEARYREVCGRVSSNTGWMATQQLRVDLIRQEYQNHLLRSATSQLLTAQSGLKEELETFRQQYVARHCETSPRTQKMEELSRQIVEERQRWEEERKALSKQLTQMMETFQVTHQPHYAQPVARLVAGTQTSMVASPDLAASRHSQTPGSSFSLDADQHEFDVGMDDHFASGEETFLPSACRGHRVRKARSQADLKNRRKLRQARRRAAHVPPDSDSSDNDVKSSPLAPGGPTVQHEALGTSENPPAALDRSETEKTTAVPSKLGSGAARVRSGCDRQHEQKSGDKGVKRSRCAAETIQPKAKRRSNVSFADALTGRGNPVMQSTPLVHGGQTLAGMLPPPAEPEMIEERMEISKPLASPDPTPCHTAAKGKSRRSAAPARVLALSDSTTPVTVSKRPRRRAMISSDSSPMPDVPESVARVPMSVNSTPNRPRKKRNMRMHHTIIDSSDGSTLNLQASRCSSPEKHVLSLASTRTKGTAKETAEPGVAATCMQSSVDSPLNLSQRKKRMCRTIIDSSDESVLNLHGPPGMSPDSRVLSTGVAQRNEGMTEQAVDSNSRIDSTQPLGPVSPVCASEGSSLMDGDTPEQEQVDDVTPEQEQVDDDTPEQEQVDDDNAEQEQVDDDNAGAVHDKPASPASSTHDHSAAKLESSESAAEGNTSVDSGPQSDEAHEHSATMQSPVSASTSPRQKVADTMISFDDAIPTERRSNDPKDDTIMSVSSLPNDPAHLDKSSALRRSVRRSKSFSSTVSKILHGDGSSRRATRNAPKESSTSSKAAGITRRLSLRQSKKPAPAAVDTEGDTSSIGSQHSPPIPTRKERPSTASNQLKRRHSLRRGASFRAMPAFPEIAAKSLFAITPEEDGIVADSQPVIAVEDQSQEALPCTPSVASASNEAGGDLSVPVAAGRTSISPSPNGRISFGPKRGGKSSLSRAESIKGRTTKYSQRILKLMESVQKTPDFSELNTTMGASSTTLAAQKPPVVVWEVSEVEPQNEDLSSPDTVEQHAHDSDCIEAGNMDYLLDDADMDDTPDAGLDETAGGNRRARHTSPHSLGKKSATGVECVDQGTSPEPSNGKCRKANQTGLPTVVESEADTTAGAPGTQPTTEKNTSHPRRSIRRKPSSTSDVVRDADGFEMPGPIADGAANPSVSGSAGKRRRLSRMLASAPSPTTNNCRGTSGKRKSILRTSNSRESMGEPEANSTRLSMDGSRRQSVAISTLASSQVKGGGPGRRTLFSQRENSFREPLGNVTNPSMGATSLFGDTMVSNASRVKRNDTANRLSQKQSMQMMMGLFRSNFKAPTVRTHSGQK